MTADNKATLWATSLQTACNGHSKFQPVNPKMCQCKLHLTIHHVYFDVCKGVKVIQTGKAVLPNVLFLTDSIKSFNFISHFKAVCKQSSAQKSMTSTLQFVVFYLKTWGLSWQKCFCWINKRSCKLQSIASFLFLLVMDHYLRQSCIGTCFINWSYRSYSVTFYIILY